MYTPYIFRDENLNLFLIKAVAVVIECKSQFLNSEILKEWAERIAALEISLKYYVRIATKITDGKNDAINT